MRPVPLQVKHTMPLCPATVTGRHGGGPCLCIARWVHAWEPRDVAPAIDAVFKDRTADGRRLAKGSFR